MALLTGWCPTGWFRQTQNRGWTPNYWKVVNMYQLCGYVMPTDYLVYMETWDVFNNKLKKQMRATFKKEKNGIWSVLNHSPLEKKVTKRMLSLWASRPWLLFTFYHNFLPPTELSVYNVNLVGWTVTAYFYKTLLILVQNSFTRQIIFRWIKEKIYLSLFPIPTKYPIFLLLSAIHKLCHANLKILWPLPLLTH